MAKVIIRLEIEKDDMTGQIYPGWFGDIRVWGHDKLHSGQYEIKGTTKKQLWNELKRYI